jgi:L-amino acid N-acyltransferase YncA
VIEVAVRPARPDDAGAIAAIFREGIEDRVATFETRPPRPEAITDVVGEQAPVLVAERDGEIVGWAKVAPYDPVHDYYATVGEATIYVARALRGAGIGSALIDALCATAGAAGFHKLVGKVFTTNATSIAMFERHGWIQVGIHRRHGRLDGEWKDVLVVEKLLGDAAE